MFVFYIIALLCFSSSHAKLKLQQEKQVIDMRITKCAIDIANANFNFRMATVVIDKNVEEEIVNNFLMKFNGTVIVEVNRDSSPVGQVVIVLDNFQSFMRILNKLKPDLKGRSLLNNGSKFLIVLLSSRKKIDRINTILWNYYVTDVIIVTKYKNNKIALYSHLPYKSHLKCRNTETTLIGFWNEIDAPKNLYANKMQNMNECPLYISTNKINYPLTEKKMPLEIIKKTIIRFLRNVMNFTAIVTTKDYISIDSVRARNWSDSLSDVLAGVANISTCTIPLGIDILGLLDYSMPYFRVRLAWLAPPVTPGPGWWRLVSPLNGYLWLLLLIVIFSIKSLPFIMKVKPMKLFCKRHFKNSEKLKGLVFKIWGILVGQPVRIAPRRFRDFYIVGLWMWFTFVIRNAYQSVLIGALKTDTVVGNFENLKEAVDAGYQIGGRAGVYAHFEYDPVIRESFQTVPEEDFEDILGAIIEGKKKFILATSLEYAFAYCMAQGRKEKECGHILPDSIMSVPLVIWMKNNSPFVKPFSIWLPRLLESGLLTDGVQKSSFCCQISSEPTPLNHHQIWSCMICLFIGYTVSFIVFLLEVFRFKLMQYVIEKKIPFRN